MFTRLIYSFHEVRDDDGELDQHDYVEVFKHALVLSRYLQETRIADDRPVLMHRNYQRLMRELSVADIVKSAIDLLKAAQVLLTHKYLQAHVILLKIA